MQAELLLHLLLLWDRLPAACLCCGIAAHVSYLRLLKPFPYIHLTSTDGMLSLGLLAASSVLWVRHFLKTYYTGGCWQGRAGRGRAGLGWAGLAGRAGRVAGCPGCRLRWPLRLWHDIFVAAPPSDPLLLCRAWPACCARCARCAVEYIAAFLLVTTAGGYGAAAGNAAPCCCPCCP